MIKSLAKTHKSWIAFCSDRRQGETPFTLLFTIQIVATLLFYFVIRVILFKYTFLSKEAYFEPSLCLEFLKHTAKRPFLWLPLLVVVGVFFRTLTSKWSEIENGKKVRMVIGFLAILLTWRHAFYRFNFFLDQSHFPDRLALVALAGLTLWRPVFVAPLVTVTLIIIGQFELIGGYSLADSLMAIQILIMFLACFLFWMVSRQFSSLNFLFLAGCIIASNYFFSGIGKLSYEWVFVDRISNMLANSHTQGWNQYLDSNTLLRLVGVFQWTNPILKVLTLTVELGILFFFFRVGWTRAVLIAAIFLHIGIFFTSGICFWFWCSIHVFFLLYVWRSLKPEQQETLFNFKRGLCAILIIASANIWSTPVKLIWLSKPFGYVSSVAVTCDDGKTIRLSPDFFSSYDYNFTFGSFHCFHPAPGVNRIGFGTNKEVFRFFTVERSDQEILQFESEFGSSRLNPARKEWLEKFLGTWMNNYNQSASNASWLSLLEPPDLLWQGTGQSRLPEGAKIEMLTLHCTTHYFSYKDGPRIVREEKIAEIAIE